MDDKKVSSMLFYAFIEFILQTPLNCEIHRQCQEAAEFLLNGDLSRFAKASAQLFQYTHKLVISEGKRHGYWDRALRVYNGKILWK